MSRRARVPEKLEFLCWVYDFVQQYVDNYNKPIPLAYVSRRFSSRSRLWFDSNIATMLDETPYFVVRTQENGRTFVTYMDDPHKVFKIPTGVHKFDGPASS